MKKIGVLPIIFISLIITISFVSSSCTVVDNNLCLGDKIIVMELSHLTNAHGEEYSIPMDYDKVLCCNKPADTNIIYPRRCDPPTNPINKIIGLSADSNTHAELPQENNYATSGTNICYGDFSCVGVEADNCNNILGYCSGTPTSCHGWPICRPDGCSINWFTCQGPPTPCSQMTTLGGCTSQGCRWTSVPTGTNYFPVLSLSHSTNAHISGPTDSNYDFKICCTEEGETNPECNSCANSQECIDLGNCDGEICDTITHKCVECRVGHDEDCKSGYCVVNKCVKCTNGHPCPTGFICKDGFCTPDDDCGDGACDHGEDFTSCPKDCDEETECSTNSDCNNFLEGLTCETESTGCDRTSEDTWNSCTCDPLSKKCKLKQINCESGEIICTYTTEIYGECDSNNERTITYVDPANPGCNYEVTVDCPSTISTEKLPFFNIYNFFLTFLALAIIYGIFYRRRKYE